jgi:hypothetical protein
MLAPGSALKKKIDQASKDARYARALTNAVAILPVFL